MSDKMDTDAMDIEEEKIGVEEASPGPVLTIADISRIVSYINKGVELNQPRLLQRAIRQNSLIRRNVTKEQLTQTVSKYIPATHVTFQPMMDALGHLAAAEVEDVFDKMSQDGGDDDTPCDAVIPEVEVYIFTLIVTTLLRNSLTELAAFHATILVDRIRMFSRRTLDLFSAKSFFYYSLAYERLDRMDYIRPTLLALYRSACLHRDDMNQAVLLNLLLRNYLHYNLVEQAQILASKTTFPENASNNQFCRYLFSMGRIQAIQLEYSEAFLRLTTAARKAPQDDSAKGFAITVHKLTVIVQLLMGEIPERSSFNSSPVVTLALKPYLALTKAVRDGNLHEFSNVVTEHQDTFKADKNYSLIQRLSHNVLKTGLRKISVSYSRISLADVAEKLQLASAQSAEYICARAIKDGVIEASIDHENGWLTSNEIIDVYSTEEPQKAFHRRIVFCLDVHNEAVKSMRYPPDSYKKEVESSKKDKDGKEDEKTIDELIKELEEEEDGM